MRGTQPDFRTLLSRLYVLAVAVASMLGAMGLWLTAAAAAQPADTPGFTVEGKIANGTAGAMDAHGLVVTVAAFRRDGLERTWEAAQDAKGRYRVADISVIDGASYVVVTEYQGATYVAAVDPAAGASLVRDLTVYESTATDPGLRFEQSAIVISEVTGPPGSFAITEIHSVMNSTDRTFVPRADGPGGPAGLLVFGLPPNAVDLSPGLGLDPARVVQISRGFASLTPVLPGRTEISFTYRVPYSQSVYRFERTIRYPVDRWRVLVPTQGIEVESAQLPASQVEIGGRGHRTLQGGPFPVGTTLGITVSGLPAGPLGLPEPLSPGLVGGAGTAIGLFVIAAHLWRTRHEGGVLREDDTADLGPSAESPSPTAVAEVR